MDEPLILRNASAMISAQQAEEIRARYMAAAESGKPLVLGKDWTFGAPSADIDRAARLLRVSIVMLALSVVSLVLTIVAYVVWHG